jgi:hypothetical protein
MSKTLTTKLLVPHRADCSACRMVRSKQWFTPWAYVGDSFWLASDGSHRGHSTRWLKVRCNDTACPGLLIVRDHDICHQLPQHIPEAPHA